MESYRQGDVLLVPVSGGVPSNGYSPRKVDPTPDGRIVLAEGEVTGHSHSLLAEDENGTTVSLMTQTSYDTRGRRREQTFLVVEGGDATLNHEEHYPHTLEEGTYEVFLQREYNPENEVRVRD